MTEPLQPGWCHHCREECRDRLGADIWPHRPELADAVVWECVFCGARVGSHEEGAKAGKPLGTAANEELRRARAFCRQLVDPIWQQAYMLPEYADARSNPVQGERIKALAIIKRTAKVRVYAFMGERLGIGAPDIAMLGLEECRALYRAMQGVTYAEVREWTQAKKAALPPGEDSAAGRSQSGKPRGSSASAK